MITVKRQNQILYGKRCLISTTLRPTENRFYHRLNSDDDDEDYFMVEVIYIDEERIWLKMEGCLDQGFLGIWKFTCETYLEIN